MRKRSRMRRAFTLVEMLVVITIIAVLAGLLFPSLTRVREESRKRTCMTNLRQIGQACILYSTEFGDYFPSVVDAPRVTSTPLKSLALLFEYNFVPVKKVFLCPSTADMNVDMEPGDSFSPHGLAGRAEPKLKQTSYGYDDTKGPLTEPDVPIAADSPPAPEEETGGVSATGPGGGAAGRLLRSGNHRGTGQNVLFYSGTVKWFTDPTCGMDYDNIYEAVDPRNPGATDSYVHQQ